MPCLILYRTTISTSTAFSKKPEIFPGEDILGINNQHKAEDLFWTISGRAWDGKDVRAINAKSESVHRTPMFREAFENDRVLIPATGFFEWDCQKAKHLFTFDEPLFCFAGIAANCEIKGEQKRCAVVLTTEANDVVSPIHVKNRMPVILHKYDHDKWLDPDTPFAELQRMMVPVKNEEMDVRPVEEGEVAPEPETPVAADLIRTKLADIDRGFSDIMEPRRAACRNSNDAE